MKSLPLPRPKKPLITELAFRLILDSEEAEGFKFNLQIIDACGKSKLMHLDKQVVLAFLDDDYTKVSVKKDAVTGSLYLVASNSISNETIKISGLADHYLSLLQMVGRATKMKTLLARNPATPILSHDFIKELNLSLQTGRQGEVAIGQYRSFDFFGKWVNVFISDVDEDGVERPICSIPLCHARNVEEEMEKLIDFANSIPARVAHGEDVMKLVAAFQAQFMLIHPFRDGNGRTGRLLTNYILLLLGKKIVSIPIQDKNDYLQSINFANSSNIIRSTTDITLFPSFLIAKYHQLNPGNPNATNEEIFEFMANYRTDENRYDFLAENLRRHQISLSSRSVIKNILNNYGKKNIDLHISVGSIRADQIDFESIT